MLGLFRLKRVIGKLAFGSMLNLETSVLRLKFVCENRKKSRNQ